MKTRNKEPIKAVTPPLYKQIKLARMKAGISLRQLDHMTGLSFANIGVYEQQGSRLSLSSIEKICRVVGVELKAVPIGYESKLEKQLIEQANEILELKRKLCGVIITPSNRHHWEPGKQEDA